MTYPHCDTSSSLVQRALAGDHDALEAVVLERYDWMEGVVRRVLPDGPADARGVDEVVREALLRIWRGRSGLNGVGGESELWAWLEGKVLEAAASIMPAAQRDGVSPQVRAAWGGSGDPREQRHARGQEPSERASGPSEASTMVDESLTVESLDGSAPAHVEPQCRDRRVAELIASLDLAGDPRDGANSQGPDLTHAFQVALANLEPKYKQIIELLYLDQLTVEAAAAKLETTPDIVQGLIQSARQTIRGAILRLSNFT